jgi:hypothetical protein
VVIPHRKRSDKLESDEVTAAIDRVIDVLSPEGDDFVSAASSRVLRKTEWSGDRQDSAPDGSAVDYGAAPT